MLKIFRNRKGGALIEYALVVSGVALISAAAISVFGHKTSDLMAATAAILPGGHADDNGAIVSGKLIETTGPAAGPIQVDVATIQLNSDTERLGNNLLGATNGGLLGDGTTGLVIEAADA